MTAVLRNIENALQPWESVPGRNALAAVFGKPTNDYLTTAVSVVSSTALVDSGLSIQLAPGKHFISLYAPLTCAAASNVKFDFYTPDGMVVNAISVTGQFTSAAATAQVQASALASAQNGGTTNAWTALELFGTVDVQNEGTLTLRIAQNVSGATATVLGVGAALMTNPITP